MSSPGPASTGPSSGGTSSGAAVASSSSPSTPPKPSADKPAADRPPVCPSCGAEVADPAVAMLCGSCGALVATRARQAVRMSLAALGISALGLIGGGIAIVATVGAERSVVYTVVALVALAGAIGVAGGAGLRHVVRLVAARESLLGRKFLVRAERIGLSAFGVLLLAGAGLAYFVFLRPLSVRAVMEQSFEGRLAPFLTLAIDPAAPLDPEKTGPPRIKGKVLIVNHQTEEGSFPGAVPGRLADAHFALPKDLRAEGPDEVGTVVWLDFRREFSGYYGSQDEEDAGYTLVANALVIHVGNPPVLVDRRIDFAGGLPPQVQPVRNQPAYGPPPVQAVVDYLLALPREP
jgi:predicted RNA-binding Zn-ribbon protein involved in translation (DUF1610 family)